MLEGSTIRELGELKIPEIIEIVKNEDRVQAYLEMPFDERLTHVIHDLYSIKMNNRNMRYLKDAKLRYPAHKEALLSLKERNLPMSTINELCTGNFLLSYSNVAIIGATGCGKTYVACAIADAICNIGKRVKYYLASDLFYQISTAGSQEKRARVLNHICNYDLLIIDEWCNDPLSVEQLGYIYNIVEDRYMNKSTIFVSQIQPSDWYPMLGSNTRAESVLDRIIHGMITVNCGSYNMREYISKNNNI